MEKQMVIIHPKLGPGWDPITYMAQLAARLFDAELLVLEQPQLPGAIAKFLATTGRRRGRQTCLLICKGPPDIWNLLHVPGWRSRFSHVAAWVIDGFWVDWIPKLLRYNRIVDQIFITTEEDVDAWHRVTGLPVGALPWGSDAFGLGGWQSERTWDLLRVGRQPQDWDDDAATRSEAEALGIKFQGRPPAPRPASDVPQDHLDNHLMLARLYQQTKFLLAFSNTAHSSVWTHTRREYVTARWTDALSCGATIAGVAPKGLGADALLWPGATLDLGTTQRAAGLALINEALRTWSPALAKKNHVMALQRLDWRWRFVELARTLGMATPAPLAAELAHMQSQISEGDVSADPLRE